MSRSHSELCAPSFALASQQPEGVGHGKIYDRLVERRTWSFMIVAAALGAGAGLVYVLVYDPLCMCSGIVGPCGCTHDEIFGWQPGSLAIPVWAAIGIVGGGILGFVADRVTRHR